MLNIMDLPDFSCKMDLSCKMCLSFGDGKAILFQFYGVTLLFVTIWSLISVRNVLVCWCLIMQWVIAGSDMTRYQTARNNDTGGCSFTAANVFNSNFYLLVVLLQIICREKNEVFIQQNCIYILETLRHFLPYSVWWFKSVIYCKLSVLFSNCNNSVVKWRGSGKMYHRAGHGWKQVVVDAFQHV